MTRMARSLQGKKRTNSLDTALANLGFLCLGHHFDTFRSDTYGHIVYGHICKSRICFALAYFVSILTESTSLGRRIDTSNAIPNKFRMTFSHAFDFARSDVFRLFCLTSACHFPPRGLNGRIRWQDHARLNAATQDLLLPGLHKRNATHPQHRQGSGLAHTMLPLRWGAFSKAPLRASLF